MNGESVVVVSLAGCGAAVVMFRIACKCRFKSYQEKRVTKLTGVVTSVSGAVVGSWHHTTASVNKINFILNVRDYGSVLLIGLIVIKFSV